MRPTFILMFFAVFGLTTSCVSKKKFEEMTGERDRLAQNLEETQSQLKTLGEEKDALMSEYQDTKSNLEGQISSLESDVSSAKKEAADAMGMVKEKDEAISGLNGLIDGAFSAYESSGLMLEEVNDAIYLKTDEPVLFSSGSIRLGSEDRSVIDSLASILKSNPNLEVIVEGHTDDDGVLAGASYRDNWDLSFRRADAVVRRLLKEGVDPGQLASAARGEYKPLNDDQSTAEAKAANRRVVFRIAPKMGDLYDAASNN